MAYDAFSEGVELGGLRTTYEINILVCYLLKSVNSAFTKQQLCDILQQDGLVNYFELTHSINELVKLKQIEPEKTANGEEAYRVTELGAKACAVIERTVSASVREKAIKAALRLMARESRERMNKVEISQVKDGCIVTMRMLDVGSDLMELKLFMPDMMQANMVKRQFLNDPQLLYKGVLSLLLRDLDDFGGLAPSEEEPLYDE